MSRMHSVIEEVRNFCRDTEGETVSPGDYMAQMTRIYDESTRTKVPHDNDYYIDTYTKLCDARNSLSETACARFDRITHNVMQVVEPRAIEAGAAKGR